jgi:long-chain acyl-CoA synthetase
MSVEFLLERFRGAGEKPAFLWRNSPYGYGWLLSATQDWRSRFRKSGIEPGSVVGLGTGLWPEGVAALLALLEERCIVVPLSDSAAGEVERRIGLARVGHLLELTPEGEFDIRRPPGGEACALYESLRAGAKAGLVLFTSGTSGEPKAAVHDADRFLAKFRRRRHDLVTLAFLLLDQVGGLDTLFYGLSNASTLVLVDERSPEAVCRAVETHGVEVLPVTPSFLALLAAGECHREFRMDSLKYVTYGAEVMPQVILRKCGEMFPRARIVQKYGATEFGTMRSESEGSGSVWVRIGGEGYETRIVDGMLQVRAESSMRGYLNAPNPFTDDGWFSTGDRVEVRGDLIRFLGRASEMINVGGRKVDPVEVENVIRDLDGVLDVHVYGESSLLLGGIVCARVRVRPGLDREALGRRLKDRCRVLLEPHQVPVKVDWTETPLSSPHRKKVRGGPSGLY